MDWAERGAEAQTHSVRAERKNRFMALFNQVLAPCEGKTVEVPFTIRL